MLKAYTKVKWELTTLGRASHSLSKQFGSWLEPAAGAKLMMEHLMKEYRKIFAPEITQENPEILENRATWQVLATRNS